MNEHRHLIIRVQHYFIEVEFVEVVGILYIEGKMVFDVT